MDLMSLNGMRFFGYHGAIPEENRLGQQFWVDLELKLDLSRAAVSDDLAHTVNYAEVHALTKEVVEGPPFKLIEALAGTVASRVMEAFPLIDEVAVKVIKPHPPFAIHFDGVSVQLTKRRESDGADRGN